MKTEESTAITRIGIDATALPKEPVGAGTYIIQLIRALAALDTDHIFVIFAQESGRGLLEEDNLPSLEWEIFHSRQPVSVNRFNQT